MVGRDGSIGYKLTCISMVFDPHSTDTFLSSGSKWRTAMATLPFSGSLEGGKRLSLITKSRETYLRPHRLHFRDLRHLRDLRRRVSSPGDPFIVSSPSSSIPSPQSPGLYSAKVYELTTKNVDLVLEDVRPYLMADGGNVDVVSVDDGVVSLKLQGACGSCPSSTTTMKMGIERVLKEKFGEAVKDIRQVSDERQTKTTVEAVNSHLDILRPAIKNYGGSVEVLSIEDGACHVKYTGPESIGSGIKAAIKENFPDIDNVIFIT